MPAWIAAALRLLAGGAAFGVGSELVAPHGVGTLDLFGGGGGAEDWIHQGGHKRIRRRRRKALTASDRADIAFIEATLGKAAGRSFAMLVVSRTAA